MALPTTMEVRQPGCRPGNDRQAGACLANALPDALPKALATRPGWHVVGPLVYFFPWAGHVPIRMIRLTWVLVGNISCSRSCVVTMPRWHLLLLAIDCLNQHLESCILPQRLIACCCFTKQCCASSLVALQLTLLNFTQTEGLAVC